MSCPECGANISEFDTECKNCGYPIDKRITSADSTQPQPVEITGVKLKPKVQKKFFIILGIIAAAVILTVFVTQNIIKQKALEEAERIKTEYVSNAETLSYTMLTGAAKAESAGNLIKKVWGNTIYEEFDPESDPYTLSDTYKFHDDFNTSLRKLFSDTVFLNDIEAIENNQATVLEKMKELKTVPEGCENVYSDLQSLYDSYLVLTNLAVNPTGSLQTYATEFNSADTDFSNKYDKMKLNFE